MKELKIQSMRKPLRPPKESKIEEYQLKMAKVVGEINEIDGTFATLPVLPKLIVEPVITKTYAGSQESRGCADE